MTGSFTGNNARDARTEFQQAVQGLAVGLSSGVANAVNQTLLASMCTQSYLRIEALVNSTQSQYDFPTQTNVVGNTGTVRPTERRLPQQDAFYVTRMQFYLANAASGTVTNFPLYTYPSPTVFVGSGEAAGLQGVYNGFLKITMNGAVVTPAFPMGNFLNVPQTQKTAATNSPLDEFNGVDGFSMQPNPVFIGSNNNQISVVLPSAVTGTFTNNDYLVMIMQGILAQNVTNLVTT